MATAGLTVAGLTGQDPTYSPRPRLAFWENRLLRLIVDPRDLPFLRLCLLILCTTVPAAVFLFIPGNLRWYYWLPYFLYNTIFLMGPYILMLHNTSHRRLFKTRYNYLNNLIPWVIGPFFGETPESYFVHHIGMHHPENNLADDLSSTMKYQRDRFSHFLHYFGTFFFLGMPDLTAYLKRKNRIRLMQRLLTGEFSFYFLCIGLAFFNWQATLAVFVWPLFFTRWMMMAGNWAQHSFIDPQSPENCFRNSITCIDAKYNRDCFNDGYHIGHHLRPSMHWTEMPVEFQKNIDRYRAEGAIVFRKIDFFIVWLFLMLQRYDWLAHYYVDLNPENPKSREQIIELLKSRTRAIPQ